MIKLFRRLLPLGMMIALSSCAPGSGTPSVAGQAPQTSQTRPNIILIVADDLGYGDISVNGSSIPTPNIDALAASGINFTNGHVTAAVCAPSRAALMTGRHQQRFGYEFNPRGRDLDGVGLPQSERALPSYLSEAGYRTALIGKWHLGRTRENHPLAHGFDEFFGFAGGGTGYMVEPGPNDDWIQNQVEGSRPGFLPMALERGYEPVAIEGGYMTDILTEEAIAFIGRNRDAPFFLTVAYHAPHSPLQATEKYLSRFAHIEDRSTRIYSAMVSALDDGVGAIRQALVREGLAENTLIVFVSDNGCAAYIGIGVCSNGPFAGYKGTYFEGGVRVPMIASWPSGLPRAVADDRLISSVDLTATLLAAARIAPSAAALDGRNLLPVLTGASLSSQPRTQIFWRTQPNFALIDGDWKLVAMERADGAGLWFGLFNLADDPGERINLAARYPERVQQLRDRFEAWSTTVPAPAFTSQRQASFAVPDGTVVNAYN